MSETSKITSQPVAHNRLKGWLGRERRRVKSSPTEENTPNWNDWKSWKIERSTLLIFSVVNLAFIGGIITLIALSNIKHGFVGVQNTSKTVAGVDWRISLTWTTLPSLIFQIYGLCVAAVVDAFGFRQPFIELARDGGVVARKTIALDYGSFFPVKREYKAWRNGHWHLFVAFTLSQILRVGLGPLAAHMLVEKAYLNNKTVSLLQDSSFYSTTSLSEPINWDLSPVIGAASSTLVYGGSYPRWSNGTHLFLNFSSPQLPRGNVSQPGIVAATQAYFARLECQDVTDDVGAHMIRIEDSSNGNGGTWWLNGTDHGCYWSTNFQISNGFTTYLKTCSNVTCGAYGSSLYSGRLIIIGATNVNFKKTLPTVISCIPTYWNSQGQINMTLDQDSRNPIFWFRANATTELRPQWWDSFESQLNQVTSIDTTLAGGTQADSATDFGRVILDNARLIDTEKALSGEVLTKSSQQVFATVYSLLVNDFMIRHKQTPTSLSGQLTYSTNRLFVYNIIISIILGLLLAVAAMLILIIQYTASHCSMLLEEPIGIIGYAGLLVDSVVNKIAAAIRAGANYQGKTRKDAMTVLDARDGTDPMFVATYQGDQRATRIALQPLASENQFIEQHFPTSGNGHVQPPAQPEGGDLPEPQNPASSGSHGIDQQRQRNADAAQPRDSTQAEPQAVHQTQTRDDDTTEARSASKAHPQDPVEPEPNVQPEPHDAARSLSQPAAAG
ncbi:uncharacterized protein Z520_07539 [Fonsecaea multimorphosa CBS 102226]|uniref:Uncharacterized protein n=1 Tax=Fonsecaea multimorphosa CBS 102226 TaxID=1442371 RepID=A0A0D2K1C1_9EURO|nr:uncharacterized protein Z520_07539 [Fonsecaea multimorphosa CBS 102226]KIX96819.1 hypothetical protein Z520_07539 [Fonsecaea multimorphosa CBS 102226]OAL22499.1 hypothetical protein AYO22_07057 [Fonsecaea multimorphosa]